MATQTTQSERILAGRYRLGGLLGRGGMAEVYEGVDERLGRPVAVKLLRSGLGRRPEVRDRFESEARSAARLSHPNVVAVYDTGEDDGTPFLVMERLPGETLADRMAAGPVDPQWARRVAGDVLGALGAAHAAGVLHRDVKPGNILIGDDGCAKVADFGIAKTAEEATGGDTTATGMLLGTPAYLAPERIDGHPATPASDLYSLGVVLYEALAGRKPFDGDTPVAVAHNVRHAEAPALASLRGDLDPGLVAVVERAMQREPSARFGTARELAEALGVLGRPSAVVGPPHRVDGDATSVLTPDGTTALPTDAVAPMPAPVSRRRMLRLPWWAAPATAAVGIVLLALVLVAAGRGGGNGVASSRADLASDLRELAGRVRVGDGPRGPELGDRLEQVASELEAGGGTQAADALLADVAAWHEQRGVYDQAAAEATTLLLRVPGAQQPTTTTAPTTTTTTQPPADEDDDRRGKGKKGRGDD